MVSQISSNFVFFLRLASMQMFTSLFSSGTRHSHAMGIEHEDTRGDPMVLDEAPHDLYGLLDLELYHMMEAAKQDAPTPPELPPPPGSPTTP